MAHRAICYPLNKVQPSGTSGLYTVIFTNDYFDDAGEFVDTANISVDVNFGTMTPAQISAAIIAQMVDMASQRGYTIAAASNQILAYFPSRV